MPIFTYRLHPYKESGDTRHCSGPLEPRWLFVALSCGSSGWPGVAGDNQLSQQFPAPFPKAGGLMQLPLSRRRGELASKQGLLCGSWLERLAAFVNLLKFTSRGLIAESAEVHFTGR